MERQEDSAVNATDTTVSAELDFRRRFPRLTLKTFFLVLALAVVYYLLEDQLWAAGVTIFLLTVGLVLRVLQLLLVPLTMLAIFGPPVWYVFWILVPGVRRSIRLRRLRSLRLTRRLLGCP